MPSAGVSTLTPLEAVRERLSPDACLEIAHVWPGSRFRQVADSVCREPRGGHAGELETSILLALAPQHVDLDRARAWIPESLAVPGVLSRTDPAHPQYSPDGIFGDPLVATAEKGVRLIAAMQADVEILINKLARARTA